MDNEIITFSLIGETEEPEALSTGPGEDGRGRGSVYGPGDEGGTRI